MSDSLSISLAVPEHDPPKSRPPARNKASRFGDIRRSVGCEMTSSGEDRTSSGFFLTPFFGGPVRPSGSSSSSDKASQRRVAGRHLARESFVSSDVSASVEGDPLLRNASAVFSRFRLLVNLN